MRSPWLGSRMRSVVYDRYGPPSVLELRELAAPKPLPGEVLVRVKAAGLNPKDSFVRKGRFRAVTGRTFPRQLGYDFAGTIESLGRGASGLDVGAPVFGMINGWAGGTLAELIVAQVDELSAKPATVSFEQAAAVPLAALTALQALRDEAKLRSGDELIIHGASGGVGLFAIQLARAMGATVTTTSSERNLELCRQLGSTRTLDYHRTSGLETPGAWRVFFDVFGNRSFSAVKPALRERGVFVSTVPSPCLAWQQLLTRFAKRRARLVQVRSNSADLAYLGGLIDAGHLVPVIDRVWPLASAAEAQAHIETKRTRGKVVITLE